MYKSSYYSRLQKIEARKNKQQGLLFILLSIAFLLLLFFVGIPLFIKAAVFLGELRSSKQQIDKTDNIPPIAPRILINYEATNSAEITLTGLSEAASTVNLYESKEKILDTITNSDGQFIFEHVNLKKGENHFYIVAIDAAGNESTPSEITNILYNDKAPKLDISNPSEGDKFFDENREIIVAGETNDETINIRVNGFVVVVDNEGNFVKKLNLTEGDNEIEIVATDPAGNQTKKTIKVNYSK